MADPVIDLLGRPLGSLRLSVTDRCNMRCRYCMPEEEYIWLPRASILSFEELHRLVGIFAGLGVSKYRLTGGEPLLRHGLPGLVGLLDGTPGVSDLALTTNGVLLARQAGALHAAGLRRVTVSLDTLRPERMIAFARSARHHEVIEGIRAARAAGFGGLKLNSVVIRGYNDDELIDLLEFARGERAELRYIEYMDVGGATAWTRDQVVTREEMLERIGQRFGETVPLPEGADPRAPASRYRLPDGTVFGIIASTTAPFCRDCDRARLTADGTLFLCLYAREGLDLREPLRTGAGDEEIAGLIRAAWRGRNDRGAEQRLVQVGRGALYPVETLRVDPHREMHVRGG